MKVNRRRSPEEHFLWIEAEKSQMIRKLPIVHYSYPPAHAPINTLFEENEVNSFIYVAL